MRGRRGKRYPRLLRHLMFDGVPLTLLAQWFRVQGYVVEEVSAADADVETFRADIARAYPERSAQRRLYLLVNYSRRAVGQVMFSGGHWAPVGGFHPASGKVLVLDVNSRRYDLVRVGGEHMCCD